MKEKNLYKCDVRITRYIGLLSTDQFNHWILEQRRLEQAKNKLKPQKWSRLHVTKQEVWMSGSVWWPGSVIRSILLSEIAGLVTFHAIPSLMAMGIQSRFNPTNKQYVLMLTPSGRHRDKLVRLLQTLCGPQKRVSECNIQYESDPNCGYRLSQDSQMDISLTPQTDRIDSSSTSSNSDSVTETETVKQANSPRPASNKRDQDDPTIREISCRLFSEQAMCKTATSETDSAPMSVYRPGINKDQLTYIFRDKKHGNVITDRGPVYMYCDQFPLWPRQT
ncbi:hypothetical protein EG68_00802 [Paragonimus skrjabini miyazakii]|uniref:Uncharacterized protein n=1 Tax=Paragonimus skrjabini miyazakii TaxID=59628 RepID=A0A8S9Z8C4_9TREM|nr:hypothetical protein EG68_00802 [Paragonimus skrjabini miyazakii]